MVYRVCSLVFSTMFVIDGSLQVMVSELFALGRVQRKLHLPLLPANDGLSQELAFVPVINEYL